MKKTIYISCHPSKEDRVKSFIRNQTCLKSDEFQLLSRFTNSSTDSIPEDDVINYIKECNLFVIFFEPAYKNSLTALEESTATKRSSKKVNYCKTDFEYFSTLNNNENNQPNDQLDKDLIRNRIAFVFLQSKSGTEWLSLQNSSLAEFSNLLYFLMYNDKQKTIDNVSKGLYRRIMSKEPSAITGDTKYFDLFLSHKWKTSRDKTTNDNHNRVETAYKNLTKHFHCWFDVVEMTSIIRKDMERGVQNSSIFVIFWTNSYALAIETKYSEDSCYIEFDIAYAKYKQKEMKFLIIEMEESSTIKQGSYIIRLLELSSFNSTNSIIAGSYEFRRGGSYEIVKNTFRYSAKVHQDIVKAVHQLQDDNDITEIDFPLEEEQQVDADGLETTPLEGTPLVIPVATVPLVTSEATTQVAAAQSITPKTKKNKKKGGTVTDTTATPTSAVRKEPVSTAKPNQNTATEVPANFSNKTNDMLLPQSKTTAIVGTSGAVTTTTDTSNSIVAHPRSSIISSTTNATKSRPTDSPGGCCSTQ